MSIPIIHLTDQYIKLRWQAAPGPEGSCNGASQALLHGEPGRKYLRIVPHCKNIDVLRIVHYMFYIWLVILTPLSVNFTCKLVVPDNHNEVLIIKFIMLIKRLLLKYRTQNKKF